LARVLASLGRIGSNINQLARAANQRRSYPTASEIARLAAEFRMIRDLVTGALSAGAGA